MNLITGKGSCQYLGTRAVGTCYELLKENNIPAESADKTCADDTVPHPKKSLRPGETTSPITLNTASRLNRITGTAIAAALGGCPSVISTQALTETPDLAPFRFAARYSIQEIMNDPVKAVAFENEYLEQEANYFAIARHQESKLTYDGYVLDINTGSPAEIRTWSAPSKECLDIAICIKALGGDPKAALVVSKDDPSKARQEACNILDKKMDTYIRFHSENPEYGGFLPWFNSGRNLAPKADRRDNSEDIGSLPHKGLVPADDWIGKVPGLDNGEWVWTLMVAERVLRQQGQEKTADKYAGYIDLLRDNTVGMFFDEKAGKVRADVNVFKTKSGHIRYETAKGGKWDYLSDFHEGIMMVLYVTLFGKGLPEGASEKIWDGIQTKRVESKYGTTWEACWGSAHESWAYLFLPVRDIPEYRDLFRIREKIRSQNASERGYPGFASSSNSPGEPGYLDGAGIEGIGSQPIRNNHIFAVYGAFPMLQEFSDREEKTGNYGLAWLLNMLKAPKMQGPLGGGESGTNDGKLISHLKTIDGSFPNIVALTGGITKETAEMLCSYGKYDEFRSIMERKYREAFGAEPLDEPVDFALPIVSVPADQMDDYSFTISGADRLVNDPDVMIHRGGFDPRKLIHPENQRWAFRGGKFATETLRH